MPLLIDRGLIEAVKSTMRVFWGLVFPRSIDRGLIEAYCDFALLEPRFAFPRSIDRGLIEAYSVWLPISLAAISAIN
jgi:hypothetical protein